MQEMSEDHIKLKQLQIDQLAKELKSHYVYDEFFVDPDRKFLGLLEKMITFFEKDDFVLHIKQNEQLYTNFKEKYEIAISLIQKYEEEKEKYKSAIIRLKQRNKENYVAVSETSSEPMYSPRYVIEETESSQYNCLKEENNEKMRELEKLKEDYFSLLDEKRNLELNLEKQEKLVKNQTQIANENSNLKEKLENLIKILDENTNEKEDLNNRYMKCYKSNSEMQEELNKYRELFNNNEKEKNQIKAKITSLNIKNKNMEKDLKLLKKKNSTLNHQNKNLIEKLEHEESERIQFEKVYNEKVKNWENSLNEYKKRKDNLFENLDLTEETNYSDLFDVRLQNEKTVEVYFYNVKIASLNLSNAVNHSPNLLDTDLKKIARGKKDYFKRRNSLMNPNFTKKIFSKKSSLNITVYDSAEKEKKLSQKSFNFNKKLTMSNHSYSIKSPDKKLSMENKENINPACLAKLFSRSSNRRSKVSSDRSSYNDQRCHIISSEFIMDEPLKLNDHSGLSQIVEVEVDESQNKANPVIKEFFEGRRQKSAFSSQPFIKKKICLDDIWSQEEEDNTPTIKKLNFLKNDGEVENLSFTTKKDADYCIENVQKIEMVSNKSSPTNLVSRNFDMVNLEMSKNTCHFDSTIVLTDKNNQTQNKKFDFNNYSINITANALDFSFDDQNKKNESRCVFDCSSFIINQENSFIIEDDKIRKRCKKTNCGKCLKFDSLWRRKNSINDLILSRLMI